MVTKTKKTLMSMALLALEYDKTENKVNKCHIQVNNHCQVSMCFFLPDGGVEYSGTSMGAGIGGFRIGFLS